MTIILKVNFWPRLAFGSKRKHRNKKPRSNIPMFFISIPLFQNLLFYFSSSSFFIWNNSSSSFNSLKSISFLLSKWTISQSCFVIRKSRQKSKQKIQNKKDLPVLRPLSRIQLRLWFLKLNQTIINIIIIGGHEETNKRER